MRKVLHEQGYSLAQIAAYLGMKQETVQKYLMEPPRPSVYKPRYGKLTRYKPFLHRRFFQEGCRNSLQMFREMHQQGYLGGSTIVVNYVTQLRQLIGEPSTAGPVMRTRPTPLKEIVASPREIAWWFCLPASRLALAASVADYLYASRYGKFAVWRDLLLSLDLRGDERVLDVTRRFPGFHRWLPNCEALPEDLDEMKRLCALDSTYPGLKAKRKGRSRVSSSSRDRDMAQPGLICSASGSCMPHNNFLRAGKRARKSLL